MYPIKMCSLKTSHVLVQIVLWIFLLQCHGYCDTEVTNHHPSAIHEYVFFGMDHQGIHAPDFLQMRVFEGAQLTYTWRELEPKPGVYDFDSLRQDLAFLTAHHKKLFIQLPDVTFEPAYICIPKYLLQKSQYHGGANQQYDIPGDDDKQAVPAGWVARRWDPAVQDRFHKLLFALGKEFDGKIAGINLAETAVEFGTSGKLYPQGFTPTIYRNAILSDMAALKQAFPRSITMEYANFMPGEWLTEDDKGYLRSIYQGAEQLKVGVGGPDLIPYKPGQMKHSYPMIRSEHGHVVTGIAVQDGDYNTIDPQTGKPTTIAELLAFAQNYLKVDYIFWSNQEPFYSKRLIPCLKNQPSKRRNIDGTFNKCQSRAWSRRASLAGTGWVCAEGSCRRSPCRGPVSVRQRQRRRQRVTSCRYSHPAQRSTLGLPLLDPRSH
jgi:hypothetical protein